MCSILHTVVNIVFDALHSHKYFQYVTRVLWGRQLRLLFGTGAVRSHKLVSWDAIEDKVRDLTWLVDHP